MVDCRNLISGFALSTLSTIFCLKLGRFVSNVRTLRYLSRAIIIFVVFSFFEKRCRKKSKKLHKPIAKGSIGRHIELLHVLNTNEI